MKNVSKIIMLILVTTTLSLKSWAGGPATEPTLPTEFPVKELPKKKNPDVKRTSICFEREDLEKFKTDCDLAQSNLIETRAALQEALDNKEQISWYQEKPVPIALAVVAAILAGIAISK